MFDRENAVGFLLLGLCAVVGGVLLYSIATGTRLRYTGPAWLAYLIGAAFIGALIYGFVSSRRGRGGPVGGNGGPQWPDPQAGRGRGGWRRWFRRGA